MVSHPLSHRLEPHAGPATSPTECGSAFQAVSPSDTASTRGRRLLRAAAARLSSATGRFVGWELLVWASLYPAYLAIRGLTIGDPEQAFAHASRLVELERAGGLFHEAALQQLLDSVVEFFSVYYMAGFGPLIATVLVWLGIRHRERYRELRTLLFGSLGIAIFFYVLYPTAPPRLVPNLGIADTVGMGAHDTGSFAGIHLNPYAAMPSMHVGWSLLVGVVGFRATRSRILRSLFVLHPLVMAITSRRRATTTSSTRSPARPPHSPPSPRSPSSGGAARTACVPPSASPESCRFSPWHATSTPPPERPQAQPRSGSTAFESRIALVWSDVPSPSHSPNVTRMSRASRDSAAKLTES